MTLEERVRKDPGIYVGRVLRRKPTEGITAYLSQMVRALVWLMTFRRSGEWPWVYVHGCGIDTAIKAGRLDLLPPGHKWYSHGPS